MKLRLPHRLQAALVAALASVSFTTLSSGTLSAAFFFGSQAFAEEAANKSGASIDIGDTNLDAQAAIDEEEGKGEAKAPGSTPTGHVGSNGVIGSSDDFDRQSTAEASTESSIDTENVGTADQANYTGTSADLPSNDLGFTSNPYAAVSDTSNGSGVDSPVTSFTQAPQIAPTGGYSAAGIGSGSTSNETTTTPVSVFGNTGSGAFGGSVARSMALTASNLGSPVSSLSVGGSSLGGDSGSLPALTKQGAAGAEAQPSSSPLDSAVKVYDGNIASTLVVDDWTATAMTVAVELDVQAVKNRLTSTWIAGSKSIDTIINAQGTWNGNTNTYTEGINFNGSTGSQYASPYLQATSPGGNINNKAAASVSETLKFNASTPWNEYASMAVVLTFNGGNQIGATWVIQKTDGSYLEYSGTTGGMQFGGSTAFTPNGTLANVYVDMVDYVAVFEGIKDGDASKSIAKAVFAREGMDYGMTFSGDVFTIEHASNQTFYNATFSSWYQDENGRWRKGSHTWSGTSSTYYVGEEEQTLHATKNNSFWRQMFGDASDGGDQTMLGNTIRLTRATGDIYYESTFSPYQLGGIIAEEGNSGTYVLGRNGNCNINIKAREGEAANMYVASNLGLSTDGSRNITIESSGTWKVFEGKSLTFGHYSSATSLANNGSITFNDGVTVSMVGGGTVDMTHTNNLTVQSGATINVGENTHVNFADGTTLAGTINNEGTVTFSGAVGGLAHTISNEGTITFNGTVTLASDLSGFDYEAEFTDYETGTTGKGFAGDMTYTVINNTGSGTCTLAEVTYNGRTWALADGKMHIDDTDYTTYYIQSDGATMDLERAVSFAQTEGGATLGTVNVQGTSATITVNSNLSLNTLNIADGKSATLSGTGTLVLGSFNNAGTVGLASDTTLQLTADTVNVTVGGSGTLRLLKGSDQNTNLGTITAPTLELAADSSHNSRFVYNANSDISGVQHLTFDGAQLWLNGEDMTGENAFAGGATFNATTYTEGNQPILNGAAMRINNSAAFNGPVEVNALTKLAFATSDTNVTFGGTVTGSGQLDLKSWNGNSGSFTISGDASGYEGAMTSDSQITLNVAQGGQLSLAGGSNIAGAVSLNGSLTLNADTASTISGAVGGAGSLTKNGAGTLMLSGANSYSGNTTVNAGTLVASNASALGTGAVNVTGGTLDLTTSVSAGALTMSSGSIKFADSVTYSSSGDISLTGGILDLTGVTLSQGTYTLATSTTGNINYTGVDFTLAGGYDKSQYILGTTGNALTLTFNDTPVPPPAPPTDLGKVMYVGDSITDGVTGQPSWRYAFFKILADEGIGQVEEGYYQHTQSSGAITTTTYGGRIFENIHSAKASARSYEAAGTRAGGRYDNSNIKNWLGQSNIKTNNQPYNGPVYKDENAPDTFFMLLGTNDLLSEGGKDNHVTEESYNSVMSSMFGYSGGSYDGTSGTFDKILASMLEANPKAKLIILEMPTWAPSRKGNHDADTDFQYLARFNQTLGGWVTSKNNANIQLINPNVGMTDVANTTKPGAGVAYMFIDDGLHPSNQGELIIAGNVAKAMGYGGRTAGMTRVAATDTAKFTFSDANVVQTLAGGSAYTHEWQGTPGSYTVDFSSLVLGNGAFDSWKAGSSDALSISVGNGSSLGILTVDEAYIKWNGNVLYSYDMSTNTDSLRIAYYKAGNAAELATTPSGYYVWLGDMLIGEGLGTSSGSAVNGLSITAGSGVDTGALTLGTVSMAGEAYAPALGTGHYENADAMYRAISVEQEGSWANDGKHNPTDVVTGDNKNIYASTGGGTLGDVFRYTEGNASSWFGAKTGANATGNFGLQIKGASTGGSTVFGAVDANTVTGNVYVELDAVNATYGSFSSTRAGSVIGSFESTITGTFTGVVNAGILNNDVYGGIYQDNSSKFIGSTDIYVNGGTLKGSVYGGGYGGSIGTADSGYTDTVAKVTITDGSIAGSVYGGGGSGSTETIKGGTEVHIHGGAIAGSVYGGGAGGTVMGNSSVEISYGRIGGDIFGGANGGTVQGDTSVTISGGYLSGNIYGNNRAASIGERGTVTFRNLADDTLLTTLEGYKGTVTASTVVLDNFTISRFNANLVTETLHLTNNSSTVLTNLTLTACEVVIDAGSDLTLDDTLNLGNTATFSGNLTLADSLKINISGAGMDKMYQATGIGYYDALAPDSGNGFRSGSGDVYVIKLADSATGTLSADETSVRANAQGCFATMINEGVLHCTSDSIYVSLPAAGTSDYFVRNGSVVYNDTAASSIGAAGKIYLLPGENGATLVMKDNLDTSVCTGGVEVAAAGGTILLGDNVVFNAANLTASAAVTLTSSKAASPKNMARFALAPSATALPVNVQLADDWTGAVRLTGSANKIDINPFANANSWVEFNGFSGYTTDWYEGTGKGVMAQNIYLTNGTNGYAWLANGGTSNTGHEARFTGKIAGDGILKTQGNQLGYKFSGDISGWNGTLQVNGGAPIVTFAGNAKEVNADIEAINNGSINLKVETDATFSKDVTGITNGLELTAGHHATFKGTTDISGTSSIGGTITNDGAMTLGGTVTVNAGDLRGFELYKDGTQKEYSGKGTYAGSGYLTTDSQYYLVKNETGATLNFNASASGEGITVTTAEDDVSRVFQSSNPGTVYYVNKDLSYDANEMLAKTTAYVVAEGITFQASGANLAGKDLILEQGSTWKSNAATNFNNQQVQALILHGDAAVTASANCSIAGASATGASSMSLGGYTLSVNGDKHFALFNTTAADAGTIQVNNGGFLQVGHSQKTSSADLKDVVVNIASGGHLTVDNDSTITVEGLEGNNGTIQMDGGNGGTITIENNLGTDCTFSGSISSKPNLVMDAASTGKQTLNLSNSATLGRVTVNGGTLELGATTGTLTTGALTVNNGGTLGLLSSMNTLNSSLVVNAGGTLTLSESANDAVTVSSLALDNGAVLDLSQLSLDTSSTTPITLVKGGTIDDSNLGSVQVVFAQGLQPTGYELSKSGSNLVLTFAPADDTLIWDDNTGDHSWSGSNNWHTQNATESHIAFTDDSDVRFTGTPGSPSPTLTTDVRAGKMTIDQDVALTVNGGSNRLAVDSIDGANANLTLNGGTVSVTNDSAVGSLNGSAALEIGQNATLTVGGKSASSYTGVLSGSGDLTHNGGGTMILSGNSSGYTGDILVTGTDSVLKLGGTNGWGASNTATGSTRTITAANGGVLDVNAQADPIQAYKVSLADGGTLRNTVGDISNGSAQLANLEVVGDNATAYIDAQNRFGLLGSGYAATTLALNGNTLVTQAGINKAFMLVNTTVTNGDGKIGTIRVDAGTLDIGSANNGKSNSVSAATTVFQLNGGTLNFTRNNANLTARGLSTGSNLGTIQGTGGTLTLSPDAGETYTFAGTVKGTRNITKEGEGSQLFTGDLHEVSGGAVSVTAGSLSLDNSNATKGNLGSAMVTGGALALDSMNVNGAVSVSGSGTLDLLSSTTVGSFSMTGGTLVMDGQNWLTASTGNISLTGGTLDLTGMILEDSQTSYTLATAAGEVSCSNVEFTLGTGYDPSLYTLEVLGNNLVLTLGQSLIWDANSDNKWDVGTSPNWHTSAEPTHGSSRFAANDSVIFESGTWAPVLQQDITAGNVAVQSGASVTVDGNSHSLSARAISIAANGSLTTTGALDANTITVGGTLTTAGSASYTLDAVLSGAGSYVKDGTGTVTLSADNSGFTGVFTINEGTVRVGNNKALGTNNAIRLSGGTLDVNGSEGTNTSHTVEFAGGTLTNSGAGKGFDKRQFVNSATITADSEINAANEMGFTASNYGAISVTFSEGTTLNKTGSATFWVSKATVSGNGAFKVSEGKLQFQQNGTYASNFEMAGGEVAGAITMAGAVTVDTTADSQFSATINTNGNALTFDGAAGLAETGVISGNGSLTKTGAGTLTLSGNNTYSGSTTVNGGTLLVSGAASLTTTSGVIVNSGGTLQFDAALGANASSSSIAVAGSSDSLPGGTLTFGGVDDNALNVTGALTLGSGSVLNVREALADFAAERGEHYTVTLAQTTSGITGELGDVLVVGQGGFAYALDRDEADPNKLVVTFVDNRTDLVWNGRDDKVWAGETTETDEHTNWHTANNVYKSRGFHDYDSVSFTSNATATLGADVVSGDLSIVGLSRTVTVKAADHDFTVDGAISGHTASLTVSNAEGTKHSRVEVAGAVDLQNMTLTKADTTLKGHVQVTGTLSAADGSLTLEQSVQAGTLAVSAVAAEIKGEAIIDTMNATGSTVTLDSASTVKGITLAGSTLTNNGAMDMKGGTISVSGTSTINGSGSMKTGGIAMAPETSLTLNGGQDVNILSGAGISGGGELHLGNATLRAEASAWSIDASITSVELADSVSGTTFRSSGYTLTVDADLSGDGKLVKEGAGSLRLNGTNTYMGDTLVNAGTLVIGGDGSLTSAVTVANGARLALADDLAASATLGDVTLNSGATLRLSGEDELSFTGTLNFGSGSTLDLSNINIVEGRTEPYVLASANSFAGDLNQVTLTMGHGIHPAEGTTPSLTIQDGKLLLSYTANVPRGLIWDGGEATWNTKDVQHWHAEGSSETGTTAFKKYDNVTFENPTGDVDPSVANVSGEVWATGMTVKAGTNASNLNTVTINTATAQDSLRVDFLNAEENTAIVKTGAGSAAIGIVNPAHSADLTVKGGSLEVMYVDLEGKGMTVTNNLVRDGGAMNLIVGREGVATNLTFDVGTALTDLQSITVNQASTLNINGSLTESTNVDNVDFNLMESATMNLDSNATASLKTTHWRFNGSGYANLMGTVNWYQTSGAWHEINHTAHVYVERVVFASDNTTIRLDDGASLEIGELAFSDNNKTERFFHAFANIKEGERQQIKVGTVNVQGTAVKSIGAIQSNAFSQLWEYQQSGDFDIQTLKGSGTLALLNYSPSNHGGQDTPEVFYIGGGNNSTFSGVLRLDDTNNGTASGRKDTVLILRDETVAQSALIEIYDNANNADFGIGIAADNVKVQGIYDASGKELKSSNKAVVFSGSIAREKDSTYQSDDIVRTLEITGKSTDTAETVYTTGAGVDKNLNIVKKGAGTQVFSGDSSKFNASIEVQEGVLEFSNTASLHIEDLTLGKDKVQQPALMKSAPLKALGSVAANVDTLAVRTDAAGENVGMAEVNGTLKAKSGAALDSNLTLASGSKLDVRDTLTTQQGEFAGQTDYVGGLDMLGNSLTLHSGTYLSDADRSALLSMQWGERYELAYGLSSLTLGDYTTEESFGYKQGAENNIEASQYFQNLQEDDYYLCYSGANGAGPDGTNVGVFYIFKAPEPTTSTLSLLALAALAARRRRK